MMVSGFQMGLCVQYQRAKYSYNRGPPVCDVYDLHRSMSMSYQGYSSPILKVLHLHRALSHVCWITKGKVLGPNWTPLQVYLTEAFRVMHKRGRTLHRYKNAIYHMLLSQLNEQTAFRQWLARHCI